MTEGVFKVSIAAPPDQVWAWVGDLGKHSSWSPKPYTVEWISGEPNQVGSRFRSIGAIPMDSHHQNEGEITERDEGKRFALEAHDKEGDYRNVFVLADGPSGTTEVTHTLTFLKTHGVASVMVPMIFPLVGKADIRKRMQLLKAKAEGTG
jgi:uncharacterized protein YndB with AHSA1/START domain